MPRAVVLLGFLSAFHLVVACGPDDGLGEHLYDSAGEINHSKVEFFLPETATQIALFTELNGHYARYKISEEDFRSFLTFMWDRYRSQHAAQDSDGGWITYTEEEIAEAIQGSPAGRVGYPEHVAKLGWKPLENAVMYAGPRRHSHAGADYYYDREAGVAFHDAGYW